MRDIPLTSYLCPWCATPFLLTVSGAPERLWAACPHCGTPGLKMRQGSGDAPAPSGPAPEEGRTQATPLRRGRRR